MNRDVEYSSSEFHVHDRVDRMIECYGCDKPLPKGTNVFRIAVTGSKYPRAYHKECAIRDLKLCVKGMEEEMGVIE